MTQWLLDMIAGILGYLCVDLPLTDPPGALTEAFDRGIACCAVRDSGSVLLRNRCQGTTAVPLASN